MHRTANSARFAPSLPMGPRAAPNPRAVRAYGLGRLGILTASLAVASLCLAGAARADEPKPDAAVAPEASDAKSKDGADAKDKADAPASSDLREDPLKRYYFLGVRFRDIVVPQFMLELFTKGGATGNLWLVGPELSTRKGGTEIDISLSYADYAFGPAVLKGKDEQDVAYEIVKSDMKLVYLTFDLLFDVPLDRSGMFDFLVGGGLGVGVVAGDLYRDQAYPTTATPDPSSVKNWKTCAASGDGGASSAYCDASNDHYPRNGKDYSEKSWLDGGQKPVVIPWVSLPQISLRIKPIKHMQARIDAGFSVTGFFTGLSAGYGF